MKFHGFGSIKEYEQACTNSGFITKRIPCKHIESDEDCFLLVTQLANPSPISVASWHLFTIDETKELMDGVWNGYDENRLAEAGYILKGVFQSEFLGTCNR